MPAAVAMAIVVSGSTAVYSGAEAGRGRFVQVATITAFAASAEDPLVRAQLAVELDGLPETAVRLQIASNATTGAIPSSVLRGHEADINAVTFSPDGRLVVTGSDDGTARIWSVDGTGEPIVLDHGEERITEVQFDPDGSHLLTGSSEGTVRIWRTDDLRQPTAVFTHPVAFTNAVFVADETEVITWGMNATVLYWRVRETAEVVATHESTPLGIAVGIRPDGTALIAGSDERGVWVVNADGSGDPVIFASEGFARTSIGLNADGTQVLVGLHEGGVRNLYLDGTTEPVTLEGPTVRFADSFVAFSPDGGFRLMASDDSARVWRPRGRGEPVFFTKHEDLINTAVFSPDGSHVVTASDDGTARVWRSRDGMEIAVLEGHGSRVTAAQFSPDGDRVVTISADNTARIWPVDGTIALVASAWASIWDAGEAFLRERVGFEIEGLEISPRGGFNTTVSGDGRYRLSTPRDGRVLIQRADEPDSTPRLLGRHDGRVNDAAFRPDSSMAVTASVDGTAILWRTDGSGPAASLPHDQPVLAARFSADGTRVVTLAADRTVRVWLADAPAEPIVVSGLAPGARTIALSPEGTQVAMVGAGDTVEVRPVEGDGAPRILRGHQDTVLSVAFSPDGRRVVTAARDGTVRVWSLDGAAPVLVLRPRWIPGSTFLPGMNSRWFSAAFSRDGSHVITLTNEGAVRAWPITWPGLMTSLRGSTNACLLAEQRIRYLEEAPDEAWSEYVACERRYGREPSGR